MAQCKHYKEEIVYVKILSFFYLLPIIFTLLLPTLSLTDFSFNPASVDPSKAIIFGQSFNNTGHLKRYAHQIHIGIDTCFKAINKHTKHFNKPLQLIRLNDSGKPLHSHRNIQLLKEAGITRFIGNMGTRSVLIEEDDIKEGKICMLFPWGGDETLQDPSLRFIINGPGLIEQQTNKIVNFIQAKIKHKKIVIFHADDEFSTKAAEVTKKDFARFGIENVPCVSYNRFTFRIEQAAADIIKADPKIVVCICTDVAAVRLVNTLLKAGLFGIEYFGVDSTYRVPAILRRNGITFSYASPVPYPSTGSSLGIINSYLKHLAEFYPEEEPTILSFTYYIYAMVVVRAMKAHPKAIHDDKALIEAIEGMKNYDLDGITINFNPANRHILGEDIIIIGE